MSKRRPGQSRAGRAPRSTAGYATAALSGIGLWSYDVELVKRSFVATALFSAISAGTVLARAEVDLRWSAPPECPQELAVRDRLRALVGPALERSELRAEGVVEPFEGRYRLTLRVLDDPTGERRIESESCSELAGAAAVALVFLVQEGEATNDGASPTATEPKGSALGESEPAAAPESPENPDDYTSSDANWEPPDLGARRRGSAGGGWDAVLQAPLGSVDWGPLPKPTFGVGLGAGLERDGWRLLLRGEFGLPLEVESDIPGIGARLGRASIGAVGCRAFRSGRFAISPCLLLSLEHVEARGTGAALRPRSDGVFWLAPGAELDLHAYLADWVALFAGISGRVESAQPRLTVERVGEIAQLSPIALHALLGVEWIP